MEQGIGVQGIGRVGRAGWIVLAAAACGACWGSRADFHEEERAEHFRAAGSVHMAVLAVAPWSHYVNVLQPRFQLEAQQAVDLVVRDSRSQSESSLEAFQTAVSAAEDRDEFALPRAPDLTTYTTGAPVAPAIGGPDPMLLYSAATALFQEVQLLNRSIRDAAIPEGYRPYLVRIQLSLMPRRRHQPYDAYTTLSFFAPAGGPNLQAGDPGDGGDLRIARADSSDFGSPLPTRLRDDSAWTGGSDSVRGPSVIPLLVTDNLEASLESRSSESVRRLALSMLAFPGNFASQLNMDLFQDQLKAQVHGRDLNSLLTVARLSENSIRIRIGAMQEATADYAMVPRNHFVTLLLMVPEDSPALIDLVAKTTLVDTGTGEELEGTPPKALDELFEEIRSEYQLAHVSREELEGLVTLVQRNDQTGFHRWIAEALDENDPGRAYAHSLWIDLVSLMVGSQFSSSRFELPGHGVWDILPTEFYDQTPLVLDDGAERATVTLRGASFADTVEVHGTLRFPVDGSDVTLPAESIELDASAREVRFVFPSLAAYGLNETLGPGDVRLTFSWSGEHEEFEALYLLRR